MNKQAKTLIGLIAAVIILGGVLAAIYILLPKERNNNLTTSNTFSSKEAVSDPLVSQTSDAIPLIGKQSTEIEEIKISGKANYTVKRESDGKLWVNDVEKEGRDTYSYDEFAYKFASLSASKIITETPENLSEYGLDPPVNTAHITFIKDPEADRIASEYAQLYGPQEEPPYEIELYFGKTLEDGSVYISSNMESTVLLMSEDFINEDYPDKLSFIVKDLVPKPELKTTDDNTEIIPAVYNDIRIKNSNIQTPIRLFKNTLNDPANPLNTMEYLISEENETSAILGGVKHSLVKEYIDILTPIHGKRVVSINTEESKLSEYGLDNPTAEMSFKADNKDYTLRVGKSAGEKLRYVSSNYANDFKTIMIIEEELIGFIDFKMDTLLSPVIFSYNVKSIKDISFDYNGKNHVLRLDLDSENDITKVTDNNTEIEITKFNNFYKTLINLEKTDTRPSDINFTKELKITINIKGNNNADTAMPLIIKYGNDRISEVTFNEAQYYITKEQVDILVENIESLG